MSTPVKLSDPQLSLLKACVKSPQSCPDYFPPAKALVKKKLCEWKLVKGLFGNRSLLHATETGKNHPFVRK